MTEETKQLVTILIRGLKFTASLLEKWKRGEQV